MGTAQDMDTILECVSMLKNRDDVLFILLDMVIRRATLKSI